MLFETTSYQRFCWVLGTTSFRTAQLNLTTEEQLTMLSKFRQTYIDDGGTWRWERNNELQAKFYDFMHDQGALKGDAPRKAKDARQKTSPLPPLGLTTDDRVITDAGRELVSLVKQGDFDSDNIFDIAADSYIYLKQLLKTSLEVDKGRNVRPYYVLAHLLDEFGHLTYDEFRYLMPMVTDSWSLKIIKQGITELRRGATTIRAIVSTRLKAMGSMQEALTLFLGHAPSPKLMRVIGMNRKSRTYDEVYYPLYQALKRVFLEPNPSAKDVEALDEASQKLSSPVRPFWRKLLFEGARSSKIAKDGLSVIPADCVFRDIKTAELFKRTFFWHMHLFKSLATLEDYADLNRRYLKLSDTIIFKDDTVTFDVLPRAFFRVVADAISRDMFTRSLVLEASVEIDQIAPEFSVSHNSLLTVLSREFGVELPSLTVARQYVRDERYSRLHELLDTQFTRDVLIELLDCFAVRNDKRIAELVTDVATPSTIFEYILGLIWYEISGRVGDALDYMKLQLEADLMPRTHAQGGGADIVYQYERTANYPEHALLIEVTLADGTNTRQMEMEPVSRHLGRQIIASGNENDYCIFIAPQLDLNVVNDFRYRKIMGFFDNETQERVAPLKIIPLDIKQIRSLLSSKQEYRELYPQFDEAFKSENMDPKTWMVQISEVIAS